MSAKEDWIRYRKGGYGITPPFGGWVNEEKQNALHKKRIAEYEKIIQERVDKRFADEKAKGSP